MMRIIDLQIGDEKCVRDIQAEPLVRDRLLEMGLTLGSPIKVIQFLPFSGPTIIQAGSLTVALRQSEAAAVWVD